MINCYYIHIPFCEKKCKYCAFCSFELLKFKKDYLEALKKEISFYYNKNPIKTLYIGGGTPSLLEEDEIKDIISNFKINKNTEITIELNPKSTDYKKLKKYKNIGINRISLGVQNFDDKVLSEIGRLHTKKDIYEALENIKKAGFDNFSIDLIYGLANQTKQDWERTLDEAISINPPHISLYGLKIEEGTYFYKHPPKNLPDEDMQAIMYESAVRKLKKYYKHYEFSNFAKEKKYFSKHNINYWHLGSYWGFGLSASGYIENKRYTNTANLKKYINNPLEKNYEILSKQQQTEEEIFIGLRLLKGINFNKINKKYNIDIFKKYEKEFLKYIDLKLMKKTKFGVKLTQKGILISNNILCDFIKV